MTAIELLQTACGAKIDGVIGSKTIQAITIADPYELLIKYAKLRSDRYISTKTFDIFGKGWLRRLLEAAIFSAYQ